MVWITSHDPSQFHSKPQGIKKKTGMGKEMEIWEEIHTESIEEAS